MIEVRLKNSIGVSLIDICKSFGNTKAVDHVSLDIKKGEFMSLLGPSGCGKSTTLRIVAGLEKPDRGIVEFEGREVTYLPPYKRKIGFVFQDYALWPHMTVFENISFGLVLRKISKEEIKDRINQILILTGLSGLENRFPREISGGQQQRVSLARALVLKPTILLLDEPLSSLDRKLRVNMRVELKEMQKKIGITALYVTHDQEESLSMSDRIAVMNKGEIIEVGTPKEIYEKPKARFVAEFVGSNNFIEGEIVKFENSFFIVKIGENNVLKLSAKTVLQLKVGDKVTVLSRPERIELRSNLLEGENVFLGEVKSIDYLGETVRYFVKLESGPMLIADNKAYRYTFSTGEKIYIKLHDEHCSMMV